MQLISLQRMISFPRRPLVMGIVNLSADSFSGDGSGDPGRALEMAVEMATSGADIIDIGAESARTNREAIQIGEEIDRLIPFLADFEATLLDRGANPVDSNQLWPPLLSVNTWRPEVLDAILPLGGIHIVNDIGGLPDPGSAERCAEHGCALLIMHTVGQPKVSHTAQRYPNVLDTIERFFEEKIALAVSAGLPEEQIILDPGIDFAKQHDDNLAIYRDLKRFQRFGLPILLPVSRKTVIGDVLGIEDAADRDAGTIACLVRGVTQGAHIFRVHNVPAAVNSLKVLDPLMSE